MGDRQKLYLEGSVHVDPLVEGHRREGEPTFVDQKAPRRVFRQHALHSRRAVARGRLDAEALAAKEGETQVMADVRVRQEDAVEGTPRVGSLAEPRLGNQIHLCP